MSARSQASHRLEGLAAPLVAGFIPSSPGDVVRLARAGDDTWFYCRVEERLADGDLLCSVVDAQWWPALAIDGVVPGRKYAVAADRVLSVVKPGAS